MAESSLLAEVTNLLDPEGVANSGGGGIGGRKWHAAGTPASHPLFSPC